MLPDRVSNPGPLTYESGAPTDCTTRPGITTCINIFSDKQSFAFVCDLYNVLEVS